MIIKGGKGQDFRGLANYLVDERERIAFAETRNTVHSADNPAGLSEEMKQQAGLSSRVEKPVEHIKISFHPEDIEQLGSDDASRKATMLEIADRVLKANGLEAHQALIVGHNDRGHPHLHIMVNRVGSDGKAWKRAYQGRRFREQAMALEKEYGLVRTRARSEEKSLTMGEINKQRETGIKPFVQHVREVATKDLKEAKSWKDLEGRLARNGLRVEAKGRGMVITDGTEQVKNSRVHRSVSRGKLEARFNQTYQEYVSQREKTKEPVDRATQRETESRANRDGRSTGADARASAQSVRDQSGTQTHHSATDRPGGRSQRGPAANGIKQAVAKSAGLQGRGRKVARKTLNRLNEPQNLVDRLENKADQVSGQKGDGIDTAARLDALASKEIKRIKRVMKRLSPEAGQISAALFKETKNHERFERAKLHQKQAKKRLEPFRDLKGLQDGALLAAERVRDRYEQQLTQANIRVAQMKARGYGKPREDLYKKLSEQARTRLAKELSKASKAITRQAGRMGKQAAGRTQQAATQAASVAMQGAAKATSALSATIAAVPGGVAAGLVLKAAGVGIQVAAVAGKAVAVSVSVVHRMAREVNQAKNKEQTLSR